jgi:hypothetical protein
VVRQLQRQRPCWIGFDRTTTHDELAQHRVIHPRAGEKPCPNHPALPRIRPQRPRPHMSRRALRALARPRLTLNRQPRVLWLTGRCRFDAVAITHLHIHTVRRTTDRTDLLTRRTQRVAAAFTPATPTLKRRATPGGDKRDGLSPDSSPGLAPTKISVMLALQQHDRQVREQLGGRRRSARHSAVERVGPGAVG